VSRFPAFKQHRHSSTATQPIRHFGIFIDEGAVLLNGRTGSGQPPGLRLDFFLKAASADCARPPAFATSQSYSRGGSISRADAVCGHDVLTLVMAEATRVESGSLAKIAITTDGCEGFVAGRSKGGAKRVEKGRQIGDLINR
jgi:hypothetical protein